MTPVVSLPIADWNEQCSGSVQERALCALEEGSVLLLPRLAFSILEAEQPLLSPAIEGASKNISFDGSVGKLRGASVAAPEHRLLQSMMERFATSCKGLLINLFPNYRASLVQSRTSFRPVEIAGRQTSWRKDDKRLHVDSFPSNPVRDRRILRVFSNVNPSGQSRSWKLGESFESVASRYLPTLTRPVWGVSELLRLSGVTKSRRSAYDHFMLQIHDRMKSNLEYQATVDQAAYEFLPGSTWIVFTDQVSHAAVAGQYCLEQTFFLPVAAMRDPSRAPLKVLERLTGRTLT